MNVYLTSYKWFTISRLKQVGKPFERLMKAFAWVSKPFERLMKNFERDSQVTLMADEKKITRMGKQAIIQRVFRIINAFFRIMFLKISA